jgi:transposase InsO family protein
MDFSSCGSHAALGVTARPKAEWLARQLTEACGWDEPPRYLIRDRDGAYGASFIRRIRAMGIRDRPVSARSPWQNGYAERLIGSIRGECLDHVVIGERHLRHVLDRTKNTTTRSERTYRCRRTRRFGVMCTKQGASVRRRSWAGHTIIMFEFEFPTGTGPVGRTGCGGGAGSRQGRQSTTRSIRGTAL